MNRRLVLAVAALLALGSPALAQQLGPGAKPETLDFRDDSASWIADPHVHAFYDLTVQAFAQGPAAVDEAAYTQKAYALFRDFGVARGVPPEHMVNHLKAIPGEMLMIVRRDPSVLKSYDAFTVQLFGPQKPGS